MKPQLPHRQPTGHEASPRVSTITIFLDEERFLAEAIESVLAQTYEDWELLLCDDGSTDRSPAIARAYAEAHPGRIRYLQHPGGANRGMSATRNLGLAHARGEYVAFLDGDDVWLPEKLERQVPILDAHPEAAMTFGPSVWWKSWATGEPHHDAVTDLSVKPIGVVTGEQVLGRILQHKGESLFTCSILARRSACLEVGAFEERFTGLEEDRVFFSKFLLAYNVFVGPETLDLYRQHPDSCCATARRNGGEWAAPVLTARREYLRWLRGYVSSQKASLWLQWLVSREYWLHRFPPVARAVLTARFETRNAFGKAIEFAFAASRLVLPKKVRTSMWKVISRVARHSDTSTA